MEVFLSPSDFAFLWSDCKRCFWLKVRHNQRKPDGAFPRVFTILDESQKKLFRGMHTSRILPEMPAGVFAFADGWVKSKPFRIAKDLYIIIRGRYDSILKLDAGDYAVVDFKTTIPNEGTLYKYEHQLMAYAFALENADDKEARLEPVSDVGLLCFEPTNMSRGSEGDYNFVTRPLWLGARTDYKPLEKTIRGMAKLAASEEPPPPGEKCSLCAYREQARQNTW